MNNQERDCRVGCAANWPVNLGRFQLPSPCPPKVASAYPSSPNTYPGYWCPQLPYMLWDELPPGYPGICCAITIPPFSTNIDLAQAAATMVGYDYGTETDPVVICDGLISYTSQ